MNLLQNKIVLYGYGILIVYNVYKTIDEYINDESHNYKSKMSIMDYHNKVLIGTFVGISYGFVSPITFTYKTIKYLDNKINNK